eukprot:TRINITY_DN315_c0_g2_i2.p1 TRINITY_DN315_c0_g2~~TRINITY_DN315_c0_g2_i2.p1  ORF type:complete len:871 (+),score=274.24 TRINITY_DN315_c0_g2_i2:122-2734(+)
MNARIFSFLLLIPVQLLGQCVTNDFGVAYHGNTVFSISSANNTCACLAYHSSGRATFGTVAIAALTATRADAPTTVAGPAEFGSGASIAGTITAGRKQATTCSTSLRDGLVFRLDAAKAQDAGPYGIAVTTNGVLCNQTVGGVSGVCMLSGLNGMTLSAAGAAAVFPVGGYARTVCSWGYLGGVSGAQQQMFSFGTNATGATLYIGARGSDVNVGTRGDDVAAPPLFWAAGIWNHLCAAYDGAKLRVFWNGQQAVSVSKAWALPKPLAVAAIGAQVDGSETWHGSLYDTRVYARSLAAGEVLTLYRATRNNAGDGCDYVDPDTAATYFGPLAAAGGLRTVSGSETTIGGSLTVTAPSLFMDAVKFTTDVAHHSDARFDAASVPIRGNLTVGGAASLAAPVSITGGLTVSSGVVSAQAVTASSVSATGLATLNGGLSVAAGQNVKIAASGSGVSSVQIGSASSASTLSVSGDIYQAYPSRFGFPFSSTCSSASSGSRLNLTCPAGQTIVSIIFSSWGTPSGSCGSALGIGSCHAATSESYLSSQCLGMNSCAPLADPTGSMGDPCPATPKVWTAQISCGMWSDSVIAKLLALQSRVAVVSGCPAGYEMTGFGSNYQPVCSDINECAVNNGGCAPMSGAATCTNTAGSFVCSGCRPPYGRLTNGRCTGIFAGFWPAPAYPEISQSWLTTVTLGPGANSALENNFLQLTNNVNSITGVFIWTPPANVRGQADFHAEWTMYIGGGSNPPADGYAFIYGPDLPSSVSGANACDTGTYSTNGGITVGFTTSTTNLIRTYSNNVQKSSVGQNPVCSWCKVTVDVVGGKITVVWNNINMANNVDLGTTYVPTSTWRFGFCARTGTSNANHQINNVLVY